jgi:uncharacterized protein YbbC (DUF1343 family)
MNFHLFIFLILSLNLNAKIIVGAENTQSYLSQIQDKNIALVVNQTSRVGNSHLIDFLLSKKINIKRLFALEHGIRGDFDAGAEVTSTLDTRTGLPITSLYGKNKKIRKKDVANIDIIVFDVQDIGIRFYTYISSLKYILDACSEFDKTCIVLDRPNPNAENVSGPVLDMKFASFVGQFPIPIIYGLTIGELAMMMKGEGWVKSPLKLIVSPIRNWKRADGFVLPIKPSPNLPTMKSIELYPSLAPFEATDISVGRGTDRPFTHIGHPSLLQYKYTFTPVSIPGASKYPKHEDIQCFGIDLNMYKQKSFTLKYIFEIFKNYKSENFFISQSFFNKLIGNEYVLKSLIEGTNYRKVERMWQEELSEYKIKRKRYLYYE